ncbi:hypothetical protein QYE76_015750 [Lolium multiflorum]|uniref:Uncharacterized protein n=1 Tax=Lolium multiflorum TaxID=4521 RepID=A0AAD8U703_LOLMU|nr:hypothetical protein QYE76_015750 [Lolium multiflorum]
MSRPCWYAQRLMGPEEHARRQHQQRGEHVVIGFYFTNALLAAGHVFTVLTIRDEGSDEMKKPPFTPFSVR